MHFDQFVSELLDLKDDMRERRHIDIVEQYNRNTKRSSLIENSPCDAAKKRDP